MGKDIEISLYTSLTNSLLLFLGAFILFTFPSFVSAQTVVSGTITSDTTWAASTSPIVVSGNLIVSSSTTLTIDPGVVVKFESPSSLLTIEGALHANGTEADPIFFTSIKDDTVGGDTNGDGDATTPGIREWRLIQVTGNGEGHFTHSTIRYAGHRGDRGLLLVDGVLNLTNSTVTLNASTNITVLDGIATIVDSEISGTPVAVRQEGGSTSITGSRIFDSSAYGVQVTSGSPVEATKNWWGDATGPFHPVLNPGGLGAEVTDNVSFDPWYLDELGTQLSVDPLILQYEPILLLHPDENYRPMNVEAFVENSALWESDVLFDDLLKSRGSVTVSDIGVSGSDEWYLAFSSDEPRSFDPAVAKTRYDSLVSSGDVHVTYYAHKMEDSFVDDEGELHEFIVLQYWYFYAFNDWESQGGFNDHEGDWESVFVFLDKDTEEPRYVAYSAHHNEGEVNQLVGKYDSVRRAWESNEVEKEGDHVRSFVALGSHANYPNNGNGGVHKTSTADDITSLQGDSLSLENWDEREQIRTDIQKWIYEYRGKWGTNRSDVFDSESGPRGPHFNNVSGNIRFREPVIWAGIDTATAEKEITIDPLTFANQTTTMVFVGSLPPGNTVSVDLHDEIISFGNRPENAVLLPHFWDLETSLVNDSFEVTVAFEYDPEEVSSLGVSEKDLTIFFFDEAANLWEEIESTVDTLTKKVSFTATHFSRFGIGALPEEVTIEEFLDLFREEMRSSSVPKWFKRSLLASANRIESALTKGDTRTALNVTNQAQWMVQWARSMGLLQEEKASVLFDILTSIRDLIGSSDAPNSPPAVSPWL